MAKPKLTPAQVMDRKFRPEDKKPIGSGSRAMYIEYSPKKKANGSRKIARRK